MIASGIGRISQRIASGSRPRVGPRQLWQRLASALAFLAGMAVLYACVSKPLYVETPAPIAATQTYRYQTDIQPIFDEKCAACHGCLDAPCQLKLTSAEGVQRGASKIVVYDGARPKNLAPTRLGVDALTVDEWRQKGFFSVQYSPTKDNASALQASLLYRMLALGREHPRAENSRIPDKVKLGFERDDQCPTLEEFDHYVKDRPDQGMPLAVTGLSEQEFSKLSTWVSQGAVVEDSPMIPTQAEVDAIAQWERYLNRTGPREQLVARYLFEHLFIAHLYFSDLPLERAQPHFFELVRSSTPPGQPILPLTTVSPNDDPGPISYYRLRLITDTVLEKNHITYPLSGEKRSHFDALFFQDNWSIASLPGYRADERANPFLTFQAIPAKARYQFMLDNAQFFIRTFIRGPVCAGSIATDVIEDRFWTLFESPRTERFVNDASYRGQVIPLLGVPGQDSNLLAGGVEWEAYKRRSNHYLELRQAEYTREQPRGPGLSDLWDGDHTNRDALLTIFRHHDNASVQHGLIGTVPQTLWVMDYPLLERSYYELVVNFNVFGNVAHQVQTRLYFDLIRNSSETNFLRFLPSKARNPLLHQWYAGAAEVKLFTTYPDVDTKTSTRIHYKTSDPKSEFATKLYAHMHPIMGLDDVLNRCTADDCALPDETSAHRRADRALRPLSSEPASELPVAALLPEVTLLRVVGPGTERFVYTLVHERAHKNVAFMLGENLRLEPEKDTLTLVPGVLGTYPNFIFQVPLDSIEAFSSRIAAIKTNEDLTAVVEQWGVRRTHPMFWSILHDFTAYQRETEPSEAGLLDISRYGNL